MTLSIRLCKTYYTKTYFNISSEFSGEFGADNESIEILLGSTGRTVQGKINRQYNTNKTTVRIFCNKDMLNWIRENFKLNDIMRIKILNPNKIILDNIQYWMVAAGEGGKLWEQWQKDGIISMGLNDIGDLSQYKDSEEVKNAIKVKRNPEHEPMNDGLAGYEFAHKIKPGDFVFAKAGQSKILGIGTVISGYKYIPSDDTSSYFNQIGVKWISTKGWIVDHKHLLAVKMLTNITQYSEYLDYMLNLVKNNPADIDFGWIKFYSAMADKLLTFKDDRRKLLAIIYKIAEEFECMNYLQDRDAENKKKPLEDICPFTTFGIFNRGITDKNRIEIAKSFARLLEITEPAPKNFEGIPVLNNQNSWLFRFEKDRDPDDINKLWDAFEKAIKFSDKQDTATQADFAAAYDKAVNLHGVNWSLTFGLYWSRPNSFVSLDKYTRDYLRKSFNMQVDNKLSSEQYVNLLSDLKEKFKNEESPVKSFPELSLAAWQPPSGIQYWLVGASGDDGDHTKRFLTEKFWENGYNDRFIDDVQYVKKGDRIAIKSVYTQKNNLPFNFRGESCAVMSIKARGVVTENHGDGKRLNVDWEENFEQKKVYFHSYRQTIHKIIPDDWKKEDLINFVFFDKPQDIDRFIQDDQLPPPPTLPYSIETAMNGLFMSDGQFMDIIELLSVKKNVILQGAPGVGKTFIAKRLAYYLIGTQDDSKVEMIQFHQSYSYEDFIQGYRPDGEGKFLLQNGIFYKFCNKAKNNPGSKYVFIIDEINRGNLSKIFGELMMLIESDKRGEKFGIGLSYAKNNEKFSIPENVYMIGTMNTADRSLAMVDFALRRRFAFMTLEPHFSSRKFKDFLTMRGVSENCIAKICYSMGNLNDRIRQDTRNLGEGFCIGHSFFCSVTDSVPEERWLEQIFKHEIKPLIDEYWFDNEEQAQAMKRLLD